MKQLGSRQHEVRTKRQEEDRVKGETSEEEEQKMTLKCLHPLVSVNLCVCDLNWDIIICHIYTQAFVFHYVSFIELQQAEDEFRQKEF